MAVMPEVCQSLMNFQHYKMAYFMPTVSRSDPSVLDGSFGAFNDSVKGGVPKLTDIFRLYSSCEVLFLRRFAIDCDHIQ